MPNYTLRNVKGSELTFTETDNNFIAGRTAGQLESCFIIGPQTGDYINQSFNGQDMTNVSTTANNIKLTPFYVGWDTTIDQVGVWQTSSGSQNLRALIYSSDSNGLPSTLLFESSTLATSGSGGYLASASFTFTANTRYWIGTHGNGTETFRGLSDTNLKPLGVGTGLNTSAVCDHLTSSSYTFGSPPATWAFNTNQLGTGGVISIGLRIA